MSIDPDLALLLPLATLDQAISDLDERVRLARNKLAKAEQTVADTEAALQSDEQALKALRAEERTLEAEVRRAEGLKASAQSAISSGMGDYDANQRQVVRCDELIDTAETGLLEILERRDTLETSRASHEQALAAARATMAELHASLDPQLTAWAEERTRLEAERTPAVAALPTSLGRTYEALRARKKLALSPIVGEACALCRVVVPLQRRSDAKRGALLHCDGCGRWLYDPVLTRPAEAEADEPA